VKNSLEAFLSERGHKVMAWESESLKHLSRGVYVKCVKCECVFAKLFNSIEFNRIWLKPAKFFGWQVYEAETCDDMIIKEIIE